MSTNKRIPKRSIIGSRVAVEAEDGVWRLGRVLSMRPGQMFSVRLDATGQVRDHSEGRILGPGFLSSLPADTALRPGNRQLVYITHNGREVEGEVLDHDTEQDCVRVDIGDGSVITKRLEEIRLMESRKSARLVNSDTDFSLLADFNIVEQRRLAQARDTEQTEAGGSSGGATPPLQSRRRLHSMSDFHDRKRQKNIDQERREAKRRQRSERQMTRGLSTSIEVPGSGPGLTSLGPGSRKRRTSESRAELDSGYGSSFGSGFFKTNEENVKECTAAMVLMNLSVSPRDKWFEPPVDFYSDLSSPPPGTPRPSPAPSLSQIYLSEDEEPHKRPRPGQLVQYQCTWRGCGRVEACQEAIEKHVRVHLGLPDPAPGTDYGGEEDFYYTEIEEELGTMELEQASDSGCSSASNDGMSLSCKPPLSPVASLKENKTGFVRILPSTIGSPASPSLASSVPANFGSCHPLGDHIGMARPSCEAPAPATIYLVTPTKTVSNNDQVYNSNSWQGKKLVSIVPRPEASPSSKSESESASPFVFKSNGSIAKSDKKCRKVYGIDQKDLWCTQCKWKKACGRFS